MRLQSNIIFVAGIVAVHLTLLYSVFDVYFTSPLVIGRDAIDPLNGLETEEPSETEMMNARLAAKVSEAEAKSSKRFEPAVKRLVLFVADGFRADSLYENDMLNTPFLRETVLQVGAVGTVQTHVPTESRPGHVAMLAGVYEDVSAITTGWRSNPVEVDSLLNRSAAAFAFGSADIVLPFVDAAFDADRRERRHVTAFTYGGELQNYAKTETWKLDAFSFDKFEQLLTNYTELRAKRGDRKENLRVEEEDSDWYVERVGYDGAVFLVHLLGMDVSGHSFKPGSKEVERNARYVDQRIQRTVSIMNHVFQDCSTLFVVTADHGMTDWGSHGASTRHETLVPLVLFGASTRYVPPCGPSKLAPTFNDADFLQQTFKVDSNSQQLVLSLPSFALEQADLCTLLAALLGLPIPSNSVGVLPDTNTLQRALATRTVRSESFARYFLLQAHHTVALLEAKRSVARRRRGWLPPFSFREFQELKVADAAAELRRLSASFRRIFASEVEHSLLSALAQESRSLCQLALRGFTHFHNHDAPVLGFFIALTFLGSSLCAMLRTIDVPSDEFAGRKRKSDVSANNMGLWLFLLANVVLSLLCFVQKVKLSHSFYCLLCLWTTSAAISSIRMNWRWLKDALSSGGRWSLLNFLVVLLSVETGLLAFEHRSALVLAQLFFCLSPLLDTNNTINKQTTSKVTTDARMQSEGRLRRRALPTQQSETSNDEPKKSGPKLPVSWYASNFWLATFCLLPTIGKWTNYWLVFSSGLVFLVAYYIVFLQRKTPASKLERLALLLFIASISISTFAGVCVEQRIEIPTTCHVISWLVAVGSLSLPFCVTPTLTKESRGLPFGARFRLLILAFATFYFLMTIAYEGFFLVALLLVVAQWSQISQLALSWSDQARLVAAFVHLVLFSFFGTGNLASINSFNVQTVYAFVTVFSPFLMTALMLFKIIIPFVLVSCALVPMAKASGVALQKFLLFTLMLSDVMALQLFFAVRNEGSWFEIGSSISRYVIVMSISIFSFLLFALAHVLLNSDPCATLRRVSATHTRD